MVVYTGDELHGINCRKIFTADIAPLFTCHFFCVSFLFTLVVLVLLNNLFSTTIVWDSVCYYGCVALQVAVLHSENLRR